MHHKCWVAVTTNYTEARRKKLHNHAVKLNKILKRDALGRLTSERV
jgi:hypothetical protein